MCFAVHRAFTSNAFSRVNAIRYLIGLYKNTYIFIIKKCGKVCLT